MLASSKGLNQPFTVTIIHTVEQTEKAREIDLFRFGVVEARHDKVDSAAAVDRSFFGSYSIRAELLSYTQTHASCRPLKGAE